MTRGPERPQLTAADGTVLRVLVVDDDPHLVRALTITLRARAYHVDAAYDGATALELADGHPPDVVVLDLGLPDMDGVEIIRRLRSRSQVSIIVLSAHHASKEKVDALDAGADDYVTKPFGMDELLARLRAAIRRTKAADTEEAAIETESFSIDLTAKKASRAGGNVRLTPTEWHVVEVLTRQPGRLVSQKDLLQEVWGPAYKAETHYLRVYMAQLRRKLEADPSRPRHFITEPGMGYRFEP